MTTFYYTALDSQGMSTVGDLQAVHEAEAIQQLRARGLYPTRISTTLGGGMAIAAAKRSTPSGAFLMWIVGAGLLAVCVLGVACLAIAGVVKHAQERQERAAPAEAQTLIIDGKKYIITLREIQP